MKRETRKHSDSYELMDSLEKEKDQHKEGIISLSSSLNESLVGKE